jgi:hypothetical protein
MDQNESWDWKRYSLFELFMVQTIRIVFSNNSFFPVDISDKTKYIGSASSSFDAFAITQDWILQ